MAKRTAGLDSAHQIGQTTPPSDILIADEGTHRRGLKNRDIEDVFGCGGRINRDMANWRPPFDSARQMGLSTSLEGVLTAGGAFAVGNCIKQQYRPISMISPQPGALWQNGWQHSIQRIKYVYLRP